MSESNKTYRIKTDVGIDTNISINLEQDYNSFEILSLKIDDTNTYKLHNANYGIVVGRVIANNGFGVENAKVSVFIEANEGTNIDNVISQLYPYATTRSKNNDGVRYNLLSDEEYDKCHQVVGTFPNKTYLLDNDSWIEVFENYYKYTSRTNKSGDYMICGVPVGDYTIHMDLDLSDCGILSQRPRDFNYKGYTIEQFMNPNQFKTGKDLDSLSQIFSQDIAVSVKPFWGDGGNGKNIGITRTDFNISFTFEPTCVFIGSVVGDTASNGITKKCMATENSGAMDELTTGEGVIEMIRKTPGGSVEEFQIKGTQLINADGVWCYQIPMNLDYVKHDEYGNIVPTNNPSQGIPTRASVRFRVSMGDSDESNSNFFRAKVLVPHNPSTPEEVDYMFGTTTKDSSYRDLFWNNVYTVKSYIPRFQKSQRFKDRKFTGIKHCNIYGQNNPMPYNNISIKLPFMFIIMCALIKSYIRIVRFVNTCISYIAKAFEVIGDLSLSDNKREKYYEKIKGLTYTCVADELCPDLEGWYFVPLKKNKDGKYFVVEGLIGNNDNRHFDLIAQTYDSIIGIGTDGDSTSIDRLNSDGDDGVCIVADTNYLNSCIEMNLANEYKVINFDFYNDWINGTIYMPRWMKFVRKKIKFMIGGLPIVGAVKGCTSMDSDGLNNAKLFSNDYRVKAFKQTRRYTQQCKISYEIGENKLPVVTGDKGCDSKNKGKQVCHKKKGMAQKGIFGANNGGVVHAHKTNKNQFVYYFKPCEWNNNQKVNLFANDVVLLGSLNDCSLYGIPQAFKSLTSSSFKIPTNLALTNMEDNGYLYTGKNGVVCGNSKVRITAETINGIGIVPLKEQSFTKYDAALKGTEEEITHLDGEDYIPMTEAAGIAWNYTGPDQGEVNYEKYFYQPGGHFLGLSCKNSETNLKSCINLSRICEEGVVMSQRIEMPRKASLDKSGKYNLSYSYFVPTGLISNDEIINTDFRSMFATLNHNKLIANRLDPTTTYNVYDFTYLRPNAFDGMFKWGSGSTYNQKLKDGEDFYIDKDLISGINEDELNDIKDNTYKRTIESASMDYQLFRMGLNSLSKTEQANKYYKYDGGYQLPQYENSFYFYFGLKDGATALDEFNKQFFSNCKSNINDDSSNSVKYLVITSDKQTIKVGETSKLNITLSDGSEIQADSLQYEIYGTVGTWFDVTTGNTYIEITNYNEEAISNTLNINVSVKDVEGVDYSTSTSVILAFNEEEKPIPFFYITDVEMKWRDGDCVSLTPSRLNSFKTWFNGTILYGLKELEGHSKTNIYIYYEKPQTWEIETCDDENIGYAWFKYVETEFPYEEGAIIRLSTNTYRVTEVYGSHIKVEEYNG